MALSLAAHGTALAEEDSQASPATNDAVHVEYWAGKVTVFGYRRVPIIGKVQFQTSNDVIATVEHRGDEIAISQQVCSVNFDKVFGAKLAMDRTAPPRMERATPTFKRQADGSYVAGDWPSGWTQEDLDKDGFPGISIDVRAPLCGGELYMASRAMSTARVVDWHGAIAGEIRVTVKQIVLGTKGTCLSLMAKDHIQELPGFIAYEPIRDR